MSPNNDCFQRALSEYREQTWDPAEFADLPTEVQREILERASRIQAVDERLHEVRAAA